MNQQIIIFFIVVFVITGLFIIFSRSEKSVSISAGNNSTDPSALRTIKTELVSKYTIANPLYTKTAKEILDKSDKTDNNFNISGDLKQMAKIVSLDNKGEFYSVDLEKINKEGKEQEVKNFNQQISQLAQARTGATTAITNSMDAAKKYYKDTYIARTDMKYYLQKSYNKYMKQDSNVPNPGMTRDLPYYPHPATDFIGEGGDATFSIRLENNQLSNDNYIMSWYVDTAPVNYSYGGFANSIKTGTTNRGRGHLQYGIDSDSKANRTKKDAPAFRIYANKDALPKGKYKPVQNYAPPNGGPLEFGNNFHENKEGIGGIKGRTLAGEKLRTEPQFTLIDPSDGSSIKIA